MNQQQLQEVFEKAVSAWERRDFAAFRVYRIQLFQVTMRGYMAGTARYYQSLLVSYVCAKPCEAIPFKAFAVGRACQALRAAHKSPFAMEIRLTPVVTGNCHDADSPV